MRFTRLVITCRTTITGCKRQLGEFTGYASSVIASYAEVRIERRLSASETPDGRPGANALVFGFSTEALAKAVPNRTGQCLMTCPTSAVFDGLAEGEERIPLGKHIRFFGDGFQKSKVLLGRRYWRIPVMDGEFLVEDSLGVAKGVAGGNLIIQATDMPASSWLPRDASRRCIARYAGRDHPVSWRHRPQRQQGRFAVQKTARLDGRCLLPNATRSRDKRITPGR